MALHLFSMAPHLFYRKLVLYVRPIYICTYDSLLSFNK